MRRVKCRAGRKWRWEVGRVCAQVGIGKRKNTYLLFGPQWRSLVGIRRSKRHQKREEERKLEGGKGKRKAQGFSSRGGGEEEEAGR